MTTRRAVALVVIVALYALHQDLWYWHEARPLAFGFLPVGLFYQALFTVATSLGMWLLVRLIWPSHLERESPGPPHRASVRGGDPGGGE